MHYVNRINKREFKFVFGHNEFSDDDSLNDENFHKKKFMANNNGLGFITTYTDKIYRYEIDNYSDSNDIDGEEFVFGWLHWTTENCDELCDSVKNDDLFTKIYDPSMFNGATMYYLRIIQYD